MKAFVGALLVAVMAAGSAHAETRTVPKDKGKSEKPDNSKGKTDKSSGSSGNSGSKSGGSSGGNSGGNSGSKSGGGSSSGDSGAKHPHVNLPDGTDTHCKGSSGCSGIFDGGRP